MDRPTHHLTSSPVLAPGIFTALMAIGAAGAICAVGPLAAQEERTQSSTKVPGGRVSVAYTPTELRGRSLEKNLKPGDVWRMSAGPAAELTTTVPLLSGTRVIAPGKYRLSTRFKGGTSFRLMLFRGPFVFTKGTPYVEVPLRLHEVERGLEKLRWFVRLDPEEGPKGDVRFRLQWGKRSLNFNLLVLPMFKAKFSLAGKPATLTCFGLPRNKKMVDQVKAGLRIHFGILEQDGEHGVRYDMFGQNTRRGFYVECRNFTVPDTRIAIEANEATAKQIQGFLKQGAGDQEASYTKWLKDVKIQIGQLKKVLDVAENLPRKVKIEARVQANRQPNTELVVELKPTGDKEGPGPVQILLNFGMRTAACKLDPKEFKEGS